MRKIAKAIEDDPAGSAYLSGPALARRTGVSQATVVRFAQALGYSGYPSYLDAHRREVAAQSTVERLKGSFDRRGDAPWRAVMLSDLNNIERTMNELDTRQFEASVKLLATSRRIYVWGVRTTSAVGDLLSIALTYLLGADRVMRLQPTLYHEQLLSAGPEDVVIVVSFPRYFRTSVAVAEFAKERKVPSIAITDSVLSPIAQKGSLVLCARSELLSFTESLAAPVSLANALVTAVALTRRDQSLASFRKLEKLWSKTRVYHSTERRPGSRLPLRA
jgi:DNA-binding MurR/RpiR family transcriptional regulator